MLKKNIKNIFIQKYLLEKLIANNIIDSALKEFEREELQNMQLSTLEYPNLVVTNISVKTQEIVLESFKTQTTPVELVLLNENTTNIDLIVNQENPELLINRVSIKTQELLIETADTNIQANKNVVNTNIINELSYSDLFQKHWEKISLMYNDYLIFNKDNLIFECSDIDDLLYSLLNLQSLKLKKLVLVSHLYCLFSYKFKNFFYLCSLLKITKIKRKSKYRKKLKIKLFKKMRFTKYLRRFIRRKKIKNKSLYIQFSFNRQSVKNNHKPTINLLQKVTLTPKVIVNLNLNFFYKLSSQSQQQLNKFTKISENYSLTVNLTKKLKMYLRNFHRKPYQKLRTARITHWKLFFKKTLRRNRYKSFINKYIIKLNLFKKNLNLLFNYFSNCKISWTRINSLENILKTFFFQKLNTHIIALPLISKKFSHWNYLKKKNYFNVKKVGKWSYLNFKRHLKPWLQRKKSAPKIVKHLHPKFLILRQLSQYDVFTNYLYFPQILPLFSLPVSEQCKDNFYIKLHMFRYNASNIWILHYFLINVKLIE